MMLPAATGMGLHSASTIVEATVFFTILIIGGVRHYRGYNRQFLRFLQLLPTDVVWFGQTWLGLAGLLVVLDSLLSHVSAVLAVLLGIPTVPLYLFALVGVFWLPSRMLPEWYLTWRAHGKPLAELREG